MPPAEKDFGFPTNNSGLWPSLDVRTSAVTLFVDRAHAVAPDTSVDERRRGAVVEICRRLDGIPLAIELAASRMQSMTAGEVRDRLDDRFRLLVGRSAVWSTTRRCATRCNGHMTCSTTGEMSLLNRCSVFAGGFDLAGAMAVAGSDDDLATLDLLDALVRKSLLVADRSSGRTRFSMLETIRRFAEEKLVTAQRGGRPHERSRTSLRGPGSESSCLVGQSAAARGLYLVRTRVRELAGRVSMGCRARLISTRRGHCLLLDVPRFLGRTASSRVGGPRSSSSRHGYRSIRDWFSCTSWRRQCYTSGRIADAITHAEAAQREIGSERFDRVPYDFEVSLGGLYAAIGQPERWVELARNVIARGASKHSYAMSSLVLGLLLAGEVDEAIDVSESFHSPAYSADNPQLRSYALFAYGIARRDSRSSTSRTTVCVKL